MKDMKIVVVDAILTALPKDSALNRNEVYQLIEQPKDESHGDFGFPCFSLAKALKQSPVSIAQSLQTALNVNTIAGINRVEAVGPYLNFYLDKAQQAAAIISQIFEQKDCFGTSSKQNKTICIEYPAPNTNKPLHLGHGRLMITGKSVVKLLQSQGNKVYSVNINNDRGIHICKSMLAYKLFADNAEPDKKTDHFVGDWYVRFAKEAEKDESLNEQAQQMLRDWENGDKEVRALWQKMNDWCLQGFAQTYKNFDVSFEKEYYESEFYADAKSVVEEGLAQGVFEKRDDGAIMAYFEKEKLPEKVVLRADGTTIYITQDILLAKLRHKDFGMDSMVYMVGNEQNLHFKQLFAILNKMGEPYAENLHHLATGMIDLPTGKMKSREGTVVDSDNLLADLVALANEETKKRYTDIDDDELKKRANAIGQAALRFFVLKYNPKSDFTYDPKASISFEGETGPYVLYAYARIQSVLKKVGQGTNNVEYSLLKAPEEIALIGLLAQYEQTVAEAAEKMAPYILCQYLIHLTKAFNSFYHTCPITQASDDLKQARTTLATATAQVLKNGLGLLHINVLDEM